MDHARPSLPRMDGGRVFVSIPESLVAQLRSIGRQEGATAAMTTLAAFTLLQSRITGQNDTVVGLSLAGRTQADVESLIGLFSCVLPFRVFVDRGMSFRDLLRSVRTRSLEAQQHQNVSVSALLEAIPSTRISQHAEIAQTLFNFRNMTWSPERDSSMSAAPSSTPGIRWE